MVALHLANRHDADCLPDVTSDFVVASAEPRDCSNCSAPDWNRNGKAGVQRRRTQTGQAARRFIIWHNATVHPRSIGSGFNCEVLTSWNDQTWIARCRVANGAACLSSLKVNCLHQRIFDSLLAEKHRAPITLWDWRGGSFGQSGCQVAHNDKLYHLCSSCRDRPHKNFYI